MVDQIFNLTKAAKFLKVSRAAIHVAMTKGRIPYKNNKKGQLEIAKSALIKYKKTKWNRQFTLLLNGKSLNKGNGSLITMRLAREISNIPADNLYYAVQHGKLPYEKIGAQYVFRLKDIEAYANKYWGVRNENQLMG